MTKVLDLVDTPKIPSDNVKLQSLANSPASRWFLVALSTSGALGYEALTKPSWNDFMSIEDGMTDDQVREILGAPESIGSDGSWDYGRGWNDGYVIEFNANGHVLNIYPY